MNLRSSRLSNSKARPGKPHHRNRVRMSGPQWWVSPSVSQVPVQRVEEELVQAEEMAQEEELAVQEEQEEQEEPEEPEECRKSCISH